MQITISLLRAAIIQLLGSAEESRSNAASTVACNSGPVFLIDGFPRAIDQGIEFERAVQPAAAVISLECSESAMLSRILGRGHNRDDDNMRSAQKRFRTYRETSSRVVGHYKEQGKPVCEIDTDASVDEAYGAVRSAIVRVLGIAN